MKTKSYFFAVMICVSTLIISGTAQEEGAAQIAPQLEQDAKFANLVRVVNIRGTCEVMNPDVGQFEAAQHNKAYPLGSHFRTAAGSGCFLVFSPEDSAEILEQSEVMVTGISDDLRTCHTLSLKMIQGEIKTTLRDNLKGNIFNINTPNAELKNITGRGEYSLTTEGENEIFQAATITGAASVEGPHYMIPALQAANTVNILTAPNRSLSRLTSVSGDFAILLHNGTDNPVNYGMSPQAIVKIWREVAPVGGRTIVSTLVVSPTGMARHRFAYVEGRDALQTGELVESSEEDLRDIPELNLLSDKKDEDEEPKKESDTEL